MTSTTQEKKTHKLIHIAYMHGPKGRNALFLRKIDDRHFAWFSEHDENTEEEMPVRAINVEEALRQAWRFWKEQSFRLLNCGFRYTLPERDEHGVSALFHQMAASYSSMNGIYYDEQLGNNCYVQNASLEALKIWKRLKTQNRL